METDYPLLAISEAFTDCEGALVAMGRRIRTLLTDTEGEAPPDGWRLLEDIAALRLLLGGLFSPAMKQAIDQEQAAWDADEKRQEPSNW